MTTSRRRRTKEEISALELHKAASKAEREAAKAQADLERSEREHQARVASARRIAAARAPAPSPKRPREMTRAERELRRIDLIAKQEAKARRAAGLECDPRTAAGQREVDIRTMGGVSIARVDRFAKLFRSKGEATAVRVAACQAFDDIAHVAAQGLYPAQGYEPKVDHSGTGSVIEGRADGIEQINEIKRAIGEDLFAVMLARVHAGMSYAAMERANYGSRAVLSALFLTATDAVARHLSIGGLPRKSPMVDAANAAFHHA